LLRMCGVNCLLAQIGTVVMAEAMTLCPVRLISDLQVRDNLADDESYFLAEVRHLRRMVVPESDGGHLLGLMDEPFRGTNSAEQVAAALAVVEHLLRTPNFFLLATHEQRLTGLADKLDGAENRHFQENLSAEGLVYDYRLRLGPAVTRNALRVLQREGYPRALLDRAQEWLGAAERGPAGEA
jgi:DNA mismatch repair ATPase MutS